MRPPSLPYRSISSRRGVASPAMDMGVLSIMGLGEGRGVMRGVFFLPSASFSFSHCSAILPQSTAELLPPDLQDHMEEVRPAVTHTDGAWRPGGGAPCWPYSEVYSLTRPRHEEHYQYHLRHPPPQSQ